MNVVFLIGAAAGCLILAVIVGFVLAYNRLQRLAVKVDEAASGIDVALEKRWDLLNELLGAVKKYLSHEYETLTGVAALRSGAEAENRRLDQQEEVSAETVRSIDREIELQSRNLEEIKRQLEAERRRSGRPRSSHSQSRRFQSSYSRNSRSSNNHSQNGTFQNSSRHGAHHSPNHWENGGGEQQIRSEMSQTRHRRTEAVGQKIGALSSVHRDLSEVTAGINALYEQYPLLNSWISLDQYQRGALQAEEHLLAARRLYNANVSLYNQTIRTIPWAIVASLCHMEAADFYEADENKRNFDGDFN